MVDEQLVKRLVALIEGDLLGKRENRPKLRVVGKDYVPNAPAFNEADTGPKGEVA